MTNPSARQAIPPQLMHKFIIEDQLWQRLVARITKETGFDPQISARIMDQALGYLRLVAKNPKELYLPSPTVDIGVRTIVLHTKDYFALCDDIADGRYIHYAPLDKPESVYEKDIVERTVAAMKVRGLFVDDPLWDGTV